MLSFATEGFPDSFYRARGLYAFFLVQVFARNLKRGWKTQILIYGTSHTTFRTCTSILKLSPTWVLLCKLLRPFLCLVKSQSSLLCSNLLSVNLLAGSIDLSWNRDCHLYWFPVSVLILEVDRCAFHIAVGSIRPSELTHLSIDPGSSNRRFNGWRGWPRTRTDTLVCSMSSKGGRADQICHVTYCDRGRHAAYVTLPSVAMWQTTEP